MLQLNYNNGSTGIATIESSSLSVPGVDAGKQHAVRVYGLKNFHFVNFRHLLNDIELILI